MSAYAGERLAKRIAAAGVCSRREAEILIKEGRVFVNHKQVLTPALNVTDHDLIAVDGRPLLEPSAVRLWVYYKPRGFLTTRKDPKGRPTVFDSLPENLPRVISVGRLDMDSEGLLLLTTSGAFARRMELPSSKIEREYRVRVFGTLSEEILSQLLKGVTYEGIFYKPERIDVLKGLKGKQHWLNIVLTEGKNREIRNMMAFFGLAVSRLIRVRYGPYQLNDMKPGEIRECALSPEHIGDIS